MNLQARGSFGHTPVVSISSHVWPPRNHEELFMGLPVAGQHLWGSFLAGGRRVVPIRQTQNDLAVRSLIFDGVEGQPLALAPKRPGFTGICTEEARGRLWGLWQPGPGDRFAYATSESTALWRERGEFEVTAEPLGQAMQLAVPDARDPLGYRARFWRVTGGTRDGAEVTGVFGHEQVFVRPGTGWFSSPYCQELEQAWVVFVTEYADGTVHHGHLQRGREGFAFAAIQRSDGDAVLDTDLRCVPTLGADGQPERVRFELADGSAWEWQPPDGGGHLALPGGTDATPVWREGCVTPVGETREVTFSHAWMETFPGRFKELR